jgi:L,D-transpeptidase catalytic domain
MKKKIKGFYLIVSSFVIAILHLPFAFAKSATGTKIFFHLPVDSTAKNTVATAPITSSLKSVYDSLHLSLKGLSQQAFDFAKQGLQKLMAEGKLLNDSIISIVDFSQPSNQKRLFVLDIKNYKVLFNTLVAHGRNSGREVATSFSNQNESYKSSPGFYITKETYEGKNGYSLKLEGIERGINDNAFERGIVIHGADYVCDAYVNSQGYIGRSQGCPAVPIEANRPIINTIKNGTCLFVYHPSYIGRSSVLN